jgi:hypothetical protein
MDAAVAMRSVGVISCVAGLTLAVRFLSRPPVAVPAAVTGPGAPATLTGGGGSWLGGPPPRLSADSLARVIARRDPFRLARQPAAVAFSPEAAAASLAPPPPRASRPELTLAGLVLGAERSALVVGLPGVEGTRVLRVGERVGDLLVRAIAEDAVVISAPDTVWTLRLRRP